MYHITIDITGISPTMDSKRRGQFFYSDGSHARIIYVPYASRNNFRSAVLHSVLQFVIELALGHFVWSLMVSYLNSIDTIW